MPTLALRSIVARFIPAGGVLLSALLFGSYGMGLLRDRVFARTFGAGAELDAYNAAFVLPELLLDVLVDAGLAAPFIPIFLRLRAEAAGGEADVGEADRFARTILTGAIAIVGIAAVAMFVFAEGTTSLIAGGFSGEQRELYVSLFRVMLVTPILFAASNTIGQVLVAERRFFWYGIAPILYNGGTILGTITLSDRLGIYGPALGTVLGAGLHLGGRLVGLRGGRTRMGLGFGAGAGSVREFVRLMLPKMLSHPVEQLTVVFFTAVASGLAAGSVTVVSYARNFQSVPVSLIAAAFALAVFPALSTAHATGDRRGFLRLVGTNGITIGVVTTLAALGILVLGETAIRVLLGGGAFGEEDVGRTAAVLGAFALSVPLESLSLLLSRAIYATEHTLLQVLATLAGFAVTVAATLALLPDTGIVAIPLGFTIGQACKLALLALALVVRLRRFSASG
jgi:putative peptidoglycan lipid II flippase